MSRYLTEDEQPRKLQQQVFALPDRWFRALPAGTPKRLVIYAHGGLNSEEAAIKRASAMGRFFIGNGCYPIFLVWKTGLLESIGDILTDARKARARRGRRRRVAEREDRPADREDDRPAVRQADLERDEGERRAGVRAPPRRRTAARSDSGAGGGLGLGARAAPGRPFRRLHHPRQHAGLGRGAAGNQERAEVGTSLRAGLHRGVRVQALRQRRKRDEAPAPRRPVRQGRARRQRGRDLPQVAAVSRLQRARDRPAHADPRPRPDQRRQLCRLGRLFRHRRGAGDLALRGQERQARGRGRRSSAPTGSASRSTPAART